jgi:hypothetical protein
MKEQREQNRRNSVVAGELGMRVKTRARKEGRKKKIMRDGLRTGEFTMEGEAAWRHKTKQRRKAKREKEIYDSPVDPLLMRFLKRRSGVIMN